MFNSGSQLHEINEVNTVVMINQVFVVAERSEYKGKKYVAHKAI